MDSLLFESHRDNIYKCVFDEKNCVSFGRFVAGLCKIDNNFMIHTQVFIEINMSFRNFSLKATEIILTKGYLQYKKNKQLTSKRDGT